MGKRQRDKGRRGEQQAVNFFKDHGIPAKRISMMETAGEDKGDIEVAGVWNVQVKSGSHVPKALYKFLENGEDFAVVKRDREKWLIVMEGEKFINTHL